MKKLVTYYYIIPIGDGYTYLCLNKEGVYVLQEKAEKPLYSFSTIYFSKENYAQEYINTHLDSKKYKPEWFMAAEDVKLVR